MRSMGKIFLALSLFYSHSVLAQGTSQYSAPKAPSSSSSGFEVGYAYTNFTNTTRTLDFKFFGKEFSDTANGATASQYNGISLAFKKLASGSIGFDGGASYMTSMDGSAGDNGFIKASNDQLIQFFADVNYSLNSNVYGFAGPNISYLLTEIKGLAVRPAPGFGGQIGLGFRVRNLNIQAGYQVANVVEEISTTTNTFEDQTLKATLKRSLGGLAAKITYLF